MRHVLGGLALFCAASSVSAQSDNWQAEVIDLSQQLNALVVEGTAIDLMIDHMHPELLDMAAQNYDMTPEQAVSAMRSGYNASTHVLDVVFKEAQVDRVVFGETESFKYGLIPDLSQIQHSSKDTPNPVQCSVKLVFGDGSGWFIHDVTYERNQAMLSDVIPELAAVLLQGLPTCAPEIS